MRNKIILVDANAPTRTLLAQILSDEYGIIEAENGTQALELIQESEQDTAAILIDLITSETDDSALLKSIQNSSWQNKIPVFVIIGDSSLKVEKKLFDYGVSECIRKPFDSILIKTKIKNITRLFQYQNELEDKVAQQTETLMKQYKILQLQNERFKKSNETIIDLLGTMVEYRNLESGQHIRRVKKYTEILATEVMREYPEFDLTPEKVAVIVAASPLHDIGKIAIPDSILLKPGRLTEKEYEYIKSHTISGCEILDNIKDAWSEEYGRISAEICRHHHERFDGNGYPDGLAGSQIPISAHIVGVADVYDALINERIYKDAIPKDHAFQMIVTGECGAFSPKLMECFRNVRTALEAV